MCYYTLIVFYLALIQINKGKPHGSTPTKAVKQHSSLLQGGIPTQDWYQKKDHFLQHKQMVWLRKKMGFAAVFVDFTRRVILPDEPSTQTK